MQIVNLFYELARQHRSIKGFFYGKAYEKGAANEAHPLLWLDDPISGQSVNNALSYTCNVDILGVPKDEGEVLAVQSSAFQVGLELAERIDAFTSVAGFRLNGYSFVSLRDYYDNSAAGFRFTYTLIQANPVDRCADAFDPSKELSAAQSLPSFNVEHPGGCAVFTDKAGLPNFTL